MEWETVIGLEVHVQLNTHSKLFSAASTAYGAEPNTQACAIDLALPGVLPVLNEAVLQRAVLLGLGINATISTTSIFARKNYFYPDLPKGYQISQFEHPIVHNGHLTITVDGEQKKIGITRAHLEEDAGKSLHEDFHGMSGIDLNRAGTPLLEIVSDPDLRSAAQAVAYLKALHSLVRYLDISDGNMQEGSFRCDANVSVRPIGQQEFGTRAEIKNINSFKFVEKAINYEVERQISVLESGGKIVQETRLYDADKDQTRSMRSKEEANDYRYFPDPDLLPVVIEPKFIEQMRQLLPELPKEKQARFQTAFELSVDEAQILASTREMADFFEATVAQTQAPAKLTANWILTEIIRLLNRDNLEIENSKITPTLLAGLLNRLHDQTISGKIAKTVIESMWALEGSADEIIHSRGLVQITDTLALEKIVDEVIKNNHEQCQQFREGKDKVLGFLVGQVMKASHGKANPGQVNTLLKQKLS